MKRALYFGLALLLCLQLCACNSAAPDSDADTQDEKTSELEDRIRELEQENQELQKQIDSQENSSASSPKKAEKTDTADVKLYEDDLFTVYYRRCEYDDDFDEEAIVFYIDNRSDKGISLFPYSVALDGESVNAYFSNSIAAHAKGECRISVDENSPLPTINPSKITVNANVVWDDDGYLVDVAEIDVIDASLN